MGRKILSLFLSGILLAGSASTASVSAEVIANEPYVIAMADTKKDEKADKGLEKSIKAVKTKIDIPKEYTDFNYYYYGSNTYTNNYWTLIWSNQKDYSYIEVSLDKDNNITYYFKYNGYDKDKSVPSYLKKELLDEAEDFIKQIAPKLYPKLEFVSSNYDGIYNNSYTYVFNRKENGIIFPDNLVTISVDAHTGEVKSAYLDWLYDANIPSAHSKITKEEAAKLIGENLNMKLTYKTDYYQIFEEGKSEIKKKAFLVYEPDIPYISIDAKSGEVYLTKSEWVEKKVDNPSKEAEEKDDVAKSPAGVLTEEEIAKIKELENLISKEKALEILRSNPYLYIDENLISFTASLSKSYGDNDKESIYVWTLVLRDERPVDNDRDDYRAFAHATVDAKTGKILSFNASLKNNYDYQTGKWLPVKIKYDREYGQKVFEKFLNGQIKDRFKKTKLVDQGHDYIAYYKEDNAPVYGGYYYRYNRFNEGVEFSYNSIYGAIDGVSGKIYSYNCNWDDDIIFESPRNAMTDKEAFDHYISKDGFDLKYEVNVINQYDPDYKAHKAYYDYSEAYEIRLVYRPDIYPYYISPFTGEQLDDRGQVYKGSKTYAYNDIADTKENREILILADMNIGFEGENFNPDKLITVSEINQLLESLGYYTKDSEDAMDSSKLITREELAYSFIKRLGLENVAKLSEIYKTGYYDESHISSKYLGAVALAKGLKLFPNQDSNNFFPKNNISRREAVQLIINFVSVANESR